MGGPPDWYRLIRAAKYLNTDPFTLMRQPAIWVEWAVGAESAEAEAERQRADRANAGNTTRR